MSRGNGRLHTTEEFQGMNGYGSASTSINSKRGASRVLSSVPARGMDVGAFPDGTLLDLVRNPDNQEALRLVVWKNGTAFITSNFQHGGKCYVPPEWSTSVASMVRLPSGIDPCPRTDVLRSNLMARISEHLAADEASLHLITQYVLYTWFPESSEVAPYLWIVGPWGSGKSTLLRILHALCRRALLISDLPPAAVYRLPSLVHPTLLVDEFEETNEHVRRLLRTGSTRDVVVPRNGKLFSTFGPKVVASRERPSDTALASRAIVIPLLPSNAPKRTLGTAGVEEMAGEFQAQLLALRLSHYWRSLNPVPSIDALREFGPRIRDIGRTLGLTFLTGEIDAETLRILARSEGDARAERHSEAEWAVAKALLYVAHLEKAEISVGGVAEQANTLLALQEEVFRMSPKKAGHVLSRLGFETRRMGSWGRGFMLTQTVLKQIHELAARLGITRADVTSWMAVRSGNAGRHCKLCTHFGLLRTEDGGHLQTTELPQRRSRGLFEK